MVEAVKAVPLLVRRTVQATPFHSRGRNASQAWGGPRGRIGAAFAPATAIKGDKSSTGRCDTDGLLPQLVSPVHAVKNGACLVRRNGQSDASSSGRGTQAGCRRSCAPVRTVKAAPL